MTARAGKVDDTFRMPPYCGFFNDNPSGLQGYQGASLSYGPQEIPLSPPQRRYPMPITGGGSAKEDKWKHRSKGMRCSTCMWWVEKRRDIPTADTVPEPPPFPDDHSCSVVSSQLTPESLGRCRRHAPSMSGWPALFSSDWCGDHKLDENRI